MDEAEHEEGDHEDNFNFGRASTSWKSNFELGRSNKPCMFG